VPNARQLTCRTFSAPIGQQPTDANLYATEYKLDAEVQEYAGCQYSANIHVAVIDSLTLQAWGKYWVDNSQVPPVVYNPTHAFGNLNNGAGCRNQLEKYFIFQTGNAAQMAGLKNMLNNGIPVGNYVLIYTWIRGNSQSIADTSVFTAMEALGADSMRYLSNDRAYIFFAKKGYPNTAQEVISPPNSNSQINFSTPLLSNWNTGTAHRDNDLRATVCLCTLKRCASDVTASGRDPHARWLLPLGAAVAVLTVRLSVTDLTDNTMELLN
jgi:hypothetical protein